MYKISFQPPIKFGSKRKPVPPGHIRVEHYDRKEDPRRGYINVIDASEIFLHIKNLEKHRKDTEKLLKKELEIHDRRHIHQIEKITNDYEKKLKDHHDKNHYLWRASQIHQTQFLAKAQQREAALWHVVHAQQRQLNSIAKFNSDKINYDIEPCDGQDSYRTAVFLAEFEFYVVAFGISNDSRTLINTLYGFLRGEAQDWLAPIIQTPKRYPQFYSNFGNLLAVFRKEFCGDVAPVDHLSRDHLAHPVVLESFPNLGE